MLELVLTWIGVVLALSLLITMAAGPLIVQADEYLQGRKRARRRSRRVAAAKAEPYLRVSYDAR
jgi:heme exporter protein D